MVTVTIIGKAYIDVEAKTDGFGAQAEKGILGAVGGIASKAAGVFAAGFALKQGADFFGGLIKDASESRRVLAETEQAIKATGGAAGVSAKQVSSLAENLSRTTGIDDELIQTGENLLLTFKNIRNEAGAGNDIFNQSTKAVLDLSKQFGGVEASAVQVGKALNDPIAGVTALTRVGIQFSDQQKDTIKALVETGDVLGAQKIILGEIAGQVGGQAEAQATAADKLKVVWGNLREELGARLLPIVDKVATALADRLPGALDAVGRTLGPVVAFIRNAFASGRADTTWLDSLVGGIRALVGAFQNASDGITSSGFAGTMEKIGITARQVFDAALPVIQRVASFIADNLQPILIGLGAAFVLLTSPITAVAAALIYAYTQFSGVRTVVDAVVSFLTGTVVPAIAAFASLVAEKFGELVGFVQTHWAAIQEAIGHVVVVVQTIIETFVDVVQALWRSFGDEILNVARIVWDQIQNVVDTAVSIISNLIEAGLALINGDWGQAWDAIKDILAAAWEYIRETIVNALRLAREAIEAGVSAIVGLVGDVPGKILSALGDLGDLLYDAGLAIMRGLKDGIVAGFNAVKDFVSGIAGKIADLKGPLDYDRRLLTPAGQAIMDGLLGGIKAQIPALESLLRQITAMFSVTGGALTETFPAGFVPPPDDDSFESNSFYSPNRGLPGATQAEDGSWWAPNAPQVKWPGPQATIAPATTLSISGPLVVVEGSVIPGQEGAIAELVRQAIVELVRNGTVGQEMWKRQQAIAR